MTLGPVVRPPPAGVVGLLPGSPWAQIVKLKARTHIGAETAIPILVKTLMGGTSRKTRELKTIMAQDALDSPKVSTPCARKVKASGLEVELQPELNAASRCHGVRCLSKSWRFEEAYGNAVVGAINKVENIHAENNFSFLANR
jgi:hypothetical protein